MSTSNPPKFLSFNWMRGVADDARISIIHRLVLMRLCLHRRNDSGECSPGYDKVADELGVHRATVFRAVDVGVRFGWLAQPIRHGQAPANFVFVFPSNVAPQRPSNVAPERPQRNPKVAGVQSQSRTGAHAKSQACDGHLYGRLNGRKRTGDSDSQTPDVASLGDSLTDPPQTPSQAGLAEPPKEATEEKNLFGKTESKPQAPRKKKGDRRSATDDGGEAFGRFWGAYPRKVAKEAARKAFAAAIKRGADAETLIAGAQRYAVERRGQEQRYTKHPATWLNGGCWEDETPGTVIDQEGNVVAVEREQEARPSSNKSPLEIYEGWLEENPSLRW
jgi:hypothetical protein